MNKVAAPTLWTDVLIQELLFPLSSAKLFGGYI